MRVNWRLSILVIEAVVVIFFFSFICITRSQFFEQYQRDIYLKEKYCNAKDRAEKMQVNKECHSFFYKTIDDPVAVFTAGLFIFTIVLAIATGGLIFVTLYGILQQGRSTERLFTMDQRPWIKVQINLDNPIFSFSQRSIAVNLCMIITNVGKTPAFDVTLPIFNLNYFQGEPDLAALSKLGRNKPRNLRFERIRDEHRRDVRSSFLKNSVSIYPGESTENKVVVSFKREDIDKMWEHKARFYNLVYISIPYKNGFSDESYETTMVGTIHFGLWGLESLPRNDDELRQSLAVQQMIRESGVPDMANGIFNRFNPHGSLCIIT